MVGELVEAQVQRAALQEMQLCLQRRIGPARAQAGDHLVRFVQEHLDHLGETRPRRSRRAIPRPCSSQSSQPLPVPPSIHTIDRGCRVSLNAPVRRAAAMNLENFTLHRLLSARLRRQAGDKGGPGDWQQRDGSARRPDASAFPAGRAGASLWSTTARRNGACSPCRWRRWGYDVTEAASGEAALDLCRAGRLRHRSSATG